MTEVFEYTDVLMCLNIQSVSRNFIRVMCIMHLYVLVYVCAYVCSFEREREKEKESERARICIRACLRVCACVHEMPASEIKIYLFLCKVRSPKHGLQLS